MATEDDNFDIDIYGDGSGYNANEQEGGDETELIVDASAGQQQQNGMNGNNNAGNESHNTVKQESAADSQQAPTETTPQQGVKRKETSDDRQADPDATCALFISDLYWWTTDDDIRGWVNQAGCEDQLKDVTFSEHKVNGKSKGQAFVEFTTPQAASATKHKIESFTPQQTGGRKYIVTYTQAHTNPFRTLPKDNPMRGKDGGARTGAVGGFNSPVGQGMNFVNAGGYRGGRGGGFNRGGMNMGFNNRNFNAPMGGPGFQPNPMAAGFQGSPMGGMPYGGAFNPRGGMMNQNMRGAPNMRGGRGGMGGMPNTMMPMGNVGGPMGGMGMGGMGMGAMPNQMGGMMGGAMPGNMGMQGGFQNQNTHYNPAFYGTPHTGGDGAWNPHGAKRTRQE
ncbi:hypothetical protein VTO42DRAFT_1675 [Malbranchea cinnamomea]